MARQTASARLRPAQGERTEIENRLSRAAALTPRRQRLMLAILENPDDTFYLSARALARRYRVDVATIVRTVQALGYRRYADFATDLRQHFVARVTPYGILEAASREKRSLADHAAHSVSRDVRGLAALQGRFRAEDAVALGRRIHRAKRTVIVGVDLACPLAMFFAYGLTGIGVDAEAPVGGAGTIAHRIRLLGRGDVVVAISFGRCLKITVDAAELARRRCGAHLRHHRQRPDAAGAAMRRLCRHADPQLDVHRLVRGAAGVHQCRDRRLFANRPAAFGPGAAPARAGSDARGSLVGAGRTRNPAPVLIRNPVVTSCQRRIRGPAAALLRSRP